MTFPRAHLRVNGILQSRSVRIIHSCLENRGRGLKKLLPPSLWERDLETCALNSLPGLGRGSAHLFSVVKSCHSHNNPLIRTTNPLLRLVSVRALDLVIHNCQVSIICTTSPSVCREFRFQKFDTVQIISLTS